MGRSEHKLYVQQVVLKMFSKRDHAQQLLLSGSIFPFLFSQSPTSISYDMLLPRLPVTGPPQCLHHSHLYLD